MYFNYMSYCPSVHVLTSIASIAIVSVYLICTYVLCTQASVFIYVCMYARIALYTVANLLHYICCIMVLFHTNGYYCYRMILFAIGCTQIRDV